VVIDEIQKLPILLDEVHRLMEEKSIKFLLTGSSARKLKKESANMLGGRATQTHLYPLVTDELNEFFELKRFLLYGGIPRIYLSDDPVSELSDYLSVYLEQEIQLEANIRNLPPFSRFLKMAALTNGQLLNYSSIASDCGLSPNTVREYYQILCDTLIGMRLEPWRDSKKRKAITTGKFYFFDLGVRNYLIQLEHLSEDTKEWGDLFEHFIVNEVLAFTVYRHKREKLYFWRDTSKHEVDLIIDPLIAMEIKSTKRVSSKHLSGLKAIQEENIFKRYLVISFDKVERVTAEKIEMVYWKNFLKDLWKGNYF
jgi:predicted AAA+ superfamily ATPase